MMRRRHLGRTGQVVSSLGLGCMGMSEFYGPADQEEAIATIHYALDVGLNFLDTADIYGMGRNETLVGQALKGRREHAFLATKFGIIRGRDGAFIGENGRPEYVHQACDASLKRLGVSVIDLYYQHRVDPLIPIEETVGAMAQLVEQGKVRYLGLSEVSVATIRRAHAVHPIAALQTEYSLWSREPEDHILSACRELGITFVAYSPLGRGMLTGNISQVEMLASDDRRRQLPRFQGENLTRNVVLVDQLKEFAMARGITPAQVALAWLYAQEQDILPLVGTKRRRYLEENLKAVEVTLSQQELQILQDLWFPNAAMGERYPESGMQAVNR
ncbi:MAG: oxidoreductase [Nitrospirales bacterium]|nr:MAG: oxidoreductase [Nitrospirales bacterium]